MAAAIAVECPIMRQSCLAAVRLRGRRAGQRGGRLGRGMNAPPGGQRVARGHSGFKGTKDDIARDTTGVGRLQVPHAAAV